MLSRYVSYFISYNDWLTLLVAPKAPENTLNLRQVKIHCLVALQSCYADTIPTPLELTAKRGVHGRTRGTREVDPRLRQGPEALHP